MIKAGEDATRTKIDSRNGEHDIQETQAAVLIKGKLSGDPKAPAIDTMTGCTSSSRPSAG